jgi:hypothetical protein
MSIPAAYNQHTFASVVAQQGATDSRVFGASSSALQGNELSCSGGIASFRTLTPSTPRASSRWSQARNCLSLLKSARPGCGSDRGRCEDGMTRFGMGLMLAHAPRAAISILSSSLR